MPSRAPVTWSDARNRAPARNPRRWGAIAAIQLASWRATYGRLSPAMVDGLDLARTAANWAQAATDSTRRLRIAENEGSAMGYALSGPASEEPAGVGELDALYLLPEAHGMGAGGILVADALTGLREAGYHECIAWVANQNTHAHGFYRHAGFRPDGGHDLWRGLPVSRLRIKLH